MRKSIRYTGIAVLSAAMLVAGTASAHDRYHRGGGGSSRSEEHTSELQSH